MDDDELDEPEINCWTYTGLIQVHPVGESTGGYAFEQTWYFSSPNVSIDRLIRITDRNIGDYLTNFADSPSFTERFGKQWTFTIIGLIVTRGC